MWWLWWQERNRIREGEIPMHTPNLAHRVKCTAAEYLSSFAKDTNQMGSKEGSWRPPSEGTIKINTDGAFVEGQALGAWGIIARSADGQVVEARAGSSTAIRDAFSAELKAMEEAFNLAAELGVIRVVFETDAQVLAMALNSKKPDFSREAAIIEDLKVQSKTWFYYCSVLYTMRATNKAAHELAKHDLTCDVNSMLRWEYEVPECASTAVMSDSAQIVA
jgi:ribonuclease HI